MSENRKPKTRLDPRAPLVLDTRELGRRPGSMRALRFTVPAPAGLGLDMIGVPAGADLECDLRLESVMEGVLVSGTVYAPLTGECGRCLEPVTDEVTVSVQQLFSYPEHDHRAPGEDDEDDDTGRLEGDFLDLEPAVRDAVVLALPLSPLCRDDCPGLCPGCGGRWDELPADHTHDQVDPRWAALQELSETAADVPPAKQRDSEN